MNEVPGSKPFGRISEYMPLIRATDGLTLSQICMLSGLEPSTIQNWIKRGFVPHPVKKKYHERHLARILLISVLREAMQIDRVGELLVFINGDADDESDDIIEEEKLYDIFREITLSLDEASVSPESVEELTALKAEALLTDYPPGSAEKITNALKIMSYAYVSGVYRKLAESMFKQTISL